MKMLLNKIEQKKLWSEIEENEKKRAEKMPDEKSAINQLHEAYLRLIDFGWKEMAFCPKNQSMFTALEIGSKAIVRCRSMHKDGKRCYWIFDGDFWPVNPVLWRRRKMDDP